MLGAWIEMGKEARLSRFAHRNRPIDFAPRIAPPKPLVTHVDVTQALLDAYANGVANGGSIDWEDIDRAYRLALDAKP